jgi:DNA-binding CsgD family transcriptional regulator
MPGPVDLLLDGLVTAYLHGYEAGAPGLRRALVAFRDLDPAADDESERWLWLASRLALALYDDRLIHELGSRNVARSRGTGAVTRLIGALTFQWYGLLLTGQFAQATELATEADTLARATGAAPWRWTWPVLEAWRGQRAETEALCTSILQDATLSAEAQMAHYALAVLHNGLSDYSAALDAALRACESEEQTIVSIALPELIEAAARANQLERASAPLSQLSSWARASGTPWALGLAARAQALASTDAVAEEHFREAIQQLRNCRITVHLARTHLVYGEWLRRKGRRQAARGQLRTAHEMLSGMGAEAFAARAGRELRATGEHPRSRTAQPSDALTAQELQIARLVATGATSREVGAQLFLSPRTIEAHLRSIFRKLGITSRRQLRDLQLP